MASREHLLQFSQWFTETDSSTFPHHTCLTYCSPSRHQRNMHSVILDLEQEKDGGLHTLPCPTQHLLHQQQTAPRELDDGGTHTLIAPMGRKDDHNPFRKWTMALRIRVEQGN